MISTYNKIKKEEEIKSLFYLIYILYLLVTRITLLLMPSFKLKYCPIKLSCFS